MKPSDEDQENLQSAITASTGPWCEIPRIGACLVTETDDALSDWSAGSIDFWTSRFQNKLFGVISISIVDGEVPVAKTEDAEELPEELKLITLNWLNRKSLTACKLKECRVYDEIAIKYRSQEDLDNALDRI